MEFGLIIGLVLVATFFVLWALRIARNTADTAEAAARTAESSRATAAAVLRQTEVAEAALVVAFEASVVPSQTTSQRFHVAPTSCNLWVHSTSFAAVMVRGRDIDGDFDVDGFPPVQLIRGTGSYPEPLPVLLHSFEASTFEWDDAPVRPNDAGFFGELCIEYSIARDGERRFTRKMVESVEGLIDNVATRE